MLKGNYTDGSFKKYDRYGIKIIAEGNYSNGKKDGEWKEHYIKNSSLGYCPIELIPVTLCNNLKSVSDAVSVCISDYLRECIGKGNYTNSCKNGEWIYYYREYEQNKLCGSCKFFYKDGSVSFRGDYTYDKYKKNC